MSDGVVRKGSGSGVVVAIAIALGVVLAYFFIPGVGCGAQGCGDVDPPRAGGPERPSGNAVVDPDAPTDDDGGDNDEDDPDGAGPDPGDAGPAAGGNGTGGAGAANGGSGIPDLGIGVEIRNPGSGNDGLPGGGSGVAADLAPGPLEVVPAGPGNGRGGLTVHASDRTARGSLEPFLVRDFRGSRYGWTLTGTMSDFAATGGDRISAERLVWIPRCGPHGDRDYPSRAVAGSQSAPGRTALLCSAPASDRVTGGQFDVAADLRMALPDNARTAGTYSATLLLTLA